MGIAPALLVCSVGSVVVQACTRVSDVDRFPVRDEELRIVETVPAQGADDVQTDARIDVCMSALVDPRSIAPVDAFLTSGEVPIDVELSLELLPWTGPGGVALAADPGAPWCEGSVLAIAPEIELEPELSYRVRIVPRMRGWDGEALDTEQEGWVSEGGARRFYLEFRVAEAEGTSSSSSGASESGSSESGSSESGSDSGSTGGEPAPSGPTLTDLFADGGPFDPSRALCSCHRDADDLAFMRLDLTDAEMAYAGLVLDARERDTGFPMVSPRLPSESFLVHKLLKQHGEPLLGVLGDAMPKDGELPYADYVAIALWIEAGALP
jgi:hypothetical protein